MSRWWLALFLLAPLAASAADPQPVDPTAEPAVRYRDRTEIDFPDLAVAGEIARPSGSVLSERRKLVFPPLYHPRDTFADAMQSAVDEVK